jgi:hypothetical protein
MECLNILILCLMCRSRRLEPDGDEPTNWSNDSRA